MSPGPGMPSPLGAVDDDHLGTPAEVWRPFRTSLPALVPSWRRVLVLAPHPDDEVLGVGGLVSTLVAAGSEIRVVLVSDGAAAPAPEGMSGPELAAVRLAESQRAAEALGLPEPEAWGLPDGALTQQLDHLVGLITRTLAPGDVCLATWHHDGHPDHEAVGAAARTACRRTGTKLVEYPVWAWHWASPDDPRVPWPQARRVVLPAEVVEAKRRAVAELASQTSAPGPGLSPVLPAAVLDRLVGEDEVVLL